MGDKTAIEWCDATFNPWWGCAKVSPGCDHCYAEAWAKRTGTAPWGVDTPRREFGDKHWNAPLNWSGKLSAQLARRPRVFCASMADVFDKNAPTGARERLWRLIAAIPGMDWLLLTKRIGNVPRMLPVDWGNGWANVWLGISVVNQEEADRDIQKLLDTPAHVRFLSCEPLLGPINLGIYLLRAPANVYYPARERIDWVISGGESGAKARPSHPDWHRSLRDQCAAAGVPFLFKQWGEWVDYPNVGSCGWRLTKEQRGARYGTLYGGPLADREFETRYPWRDETNPCMVRAGKKAAGRELDGRTHDGYPACLSDSSTGVV